MDDNDKIVFTREMFTDKIESEYDTTNQDVPADMSPDVLAYRLEIATYLRDALYALPIPEELLETACNRNGIINQTYLFWMDEASKGDEIVDKLGLSYDCTKLWLDDVRLEYRHGLLLDRINAEHEAFMEAERQKTPEEIIEDAWKITCYNDLQTMFDNEEIEPKTVDALLTMEAPLSSVYDEYLKQDMTDHMTDILDAAIDIANLQHQALTQDGHVPADPALQRFAEDYLSAYGADLADDLGEPEPEV